MEGNVKRVKQSILFICGSLERTLTCRRLECIHFDHDF